MKEQIVRTGKYASVGFILVASLPLLIPLLFFLSFLGFAFLLPLGGTLAGFLYLRKYARMLYRKLPFTIGRPRRTSRSRRIAAAPGPSAGATFSELSPEDSRRIETFEEVDLELDAVVISTVPQVVYWGEDTGDDAETTRSEAVPGAGTVAENGSRRDGGEHASEQLAEEEEDGEGPVVGSRAQENVAGAADSRSLAIGSGKAVVQEEGKPLSEEEEADSRAAVHGSSVQENSAVSIGEVPEDSPAAPPDSAGSSNDVDNRPEERPSEDEDFRKTTDTRTKVALGERGEDGENRKLEEKDEVEDLNGENIKKSALVDSTADEIADTYASVTAHGRPQEEKDEVEDLDGEDSKKSAVVDSTTDEVVDTYASVTAHGGPEEEKDEVEDLDGEDSKKSALVDNTADEIVDTYASVTAQGRSPEAIEDREKSPGVEETEDNIKEDHFEAQAGDFDTHPGVSRRERSVETIDDRESTLESEGREEEGDKDGKLEAQADDGAHRQQLNEELEVRDHPPTPAIHEAGVESKEGKIEALPDDDSALGVADQDQGRLDASPRTSVGTTTPIADDEAPESSPKPDSNEVKGASTLLPHQAHENDIWICRDCGWKYPNAKPSPKIRRNHKKNCQGRRPHDGRPSKTDMEAVLPSEDSGEFGKGGRDEDGPATSTQTDVEGDKYTGALAMTADESVSEGPSTKEIDMKSIPPEQGSSTPDKLQSEALQDEQGSNRKQASSFPAEEQSHGLLAVSPRPVDENVQDRGPARHLSVAFDEAALAAPSGHDEESGSAMACDSFRSAPDESASVASESFRSATDEFHAEIGRSSSFPSETPNFEDEQDQLTQVQEVQQLRDDLNTMKQIVGDEQASAGPLLIDIEELSESLGIALPSRSADMPEIEWAKVAVEVMKIVVGVD